MPTYRFIVYKNEDDNEGQTWDYESPEQKNKKKNFAEDIRRQLLELGYEAGQIGRMFSAGGPTAALKAVQAIEDIVQTLFIRTDDSDEDKFCTVVKAFALTTFIGVAKVGGPLWKVSSVLELAGISPCYLPGSWNGMKKFIAAGQLAARFLSDERILQIINDLQKMVDEAEAKTNN